MIRAATISTLVEIAAAQLENLGTLPASSLSRREDQGLFVGSIEEKLAIAASMPDADSGRIATLNVKEPPLAAVR